MLRKFLKIALPLAVLVGAFGIAGYLRATRPVITAAPPLERVWTVAAVPAVLEDIRPEMKLFGEIVAGRKGDLRPQVAGKVLRASPNLVEGGIVRAGEILAHLDPFDYEAALRERTTERAEARARLDELRAQLKGAEALLGGDKEQVALRRKDVKRRARLRGSGAGSAKSADDARLSLSDAEQRRIDREKEIVRLRAVIRQQESVIARTDVALERARRDLEDTKIISPFDGFIVAVETAEGKWINVGDPVARLIDANRLEVKFHISRRKFRRLAVAGGYRQRLARVVWRGREGNSPYTAYIERVGSEVDATSGGVNLYARVEAGGAETLLRPGAFVTVRIPDRLFQKVVRLPQSALHGGNTVYVIEKDRLVTRTVEIRTRIGGDVLVGGSLAAGDQVVTTRFPEIGPGLKVKTE